MSDFQTVFFCLSDKRCLMLIIKKNVEEDKSVTKSVISPQRKLGSLRNLIIIFRNLLSDKQKNRFENPTFIGLTRVSRMNTI